MSHHVAVSPCNIFVLGIVVGFILSSVLCLVAVSTR